MPSFNIGPGVRQAMADAGDEPRSDELYQSSAPNPTVSLTYGRDAIYVYYGEDNATRRLPFEEGP